jgi:hypothetical protein
MFEKSRNHILLLLITLVCLGNDCDGTTIRSGIKYQSEKWPLRSRKSFRRYDINSAIDHTLRGPTSDYCLRGSHYSGEENWNKLVETKTESRNKVTGTISWNTPYGDIDWYNGTIKSIPGEAGLDGPGPASHLTPPILDIMPLIARAHDKAGHRTRIAHTTDGEHSPNSLHYSGNAIDIDPDPGKDRLKIARQLEAELISSGRACGYMIYVEHSHLHISWKGVPQSECPIFRIE